MNPTINDNFRTQLSEKIREAEARTSLEFVPVFEERSADYLSFRLQAIFFGMILALVTMVLVPSSVPGFNRALLVLLGGLILFALLALPAVLGMLLPTSLKRARVLERAHHWFLSEEVFATRHRTGVLIFVSFLERSVFILADKGLIEKIPAERFSELGVTLAKDFNASQPGENFLSALDLLLAEALPHFPPLADDTNELSDKLRS